MKKTRAQTPGSGGDSYLDAEALAALLRRYRWRPRTFANDLAQTLLRLVGGVWDRYHFTPSREDFCQAAVLHLLQRPLEKADPTRNLHSWFTTCTIRFGQRVRNRANADRRRFDAYGQHLVDAGVPIPEKYGDEVNDSTYEESHGDELDDGNFTEESQCECESLA